jgi:AraC-like DNA-binding protein
MRDVVRLAAGPGWTPDELRLEPPPPAARHDLYMVFGDRIRWDTWMSALVFPESILARPMGVHRGGRPAQAASSESLQSGTPMPEFVNSLRHLIRSFLSVDGPDAALLARVSGSSLRTFQRNLAAAGVSFSDLLEQVRCEVALEMMRDRHLRLIDVGLELGYSDSANFTRAFKRWTGVSPRFYRQSLGA